MTHPIITIHNATTNEIVERELNEEELAQLAIDNESRLQKEAEKESKELARESALDKLAALGLSVEEIQAITGA